MARKFVYAFGGGRAEGTAAMKELLGGKGSNLAEMASLGLPVPPGFTISTEACVKYLDDGQYPQGVWEEIVQSVKRLEALMGATFGGEDSALLFSVRSGARVSMPGMMDTVLNLGLNDKAIIALARKTGNSRFAWDSYRRFVAMFGNVVMGLAHEHFEKVLEAAKKRRGADADTDLTSKDLEAITREMRKLVHKEKGEFPQEPYQQLRMAIDAVFRSWNTPRAVTYRRLQRIPSDWGTAVNVQTMVFGNMGERSGTGVAFTRDPATGERSFYGEFLINAQGEDVVAGIRTPRPLAELKGLFPEIYDQLDEIREKLEKHFRDMQDIEFTIQEGRLYMLQTRAGKRTAMAAARMAVEMTEERLIDKATALERVEPEQINQLLHPMLDQDEKVEVIARGLPASPGAAVGKAVFTAEQAEALAGEGEHVVLVRAETSPEDIGGMHAAQGILTARGGMTSHAAVVARGMGKCCIVGCSAVEIDERGGFFRIGRVKVKEGDFITLNGSTGEVILGSAKLVQPKLGGSFARLMSWADEVRTLGVRANADTSHDAQVARDFGAEGIGLCRTEHMFFEGDRIGAVREMILAESKDHRRRALEKILPMQRGDFYEILKVMEGLPVTIRLLDPPLHEFLPRAEEEMAELASRMKVPLSQLRIAVERHSEFNPMLGHRGCRLGISYPEIYEIQSVAIFEAACRLVTEGYKVFPEIMIPLVGDAEELAIIRKLVVETAQRVMAEKEVKVDYLVGTMIELPRACLTAGEIAAVADFFSFGTNDLTQTVYGLSRDDAGTFLPEYIAKGIFPVDPFVVLDREGVGELIKMACEEGLVRRPGLKVGICGEHGGEPSSVEFCHMLGLDYVSCSPYRVPVARLAAAQAALRHPRPEAA